MQWGTDRSLWIRMGATLVLVALIPLVFTATTAATFNRFVAPIIEWVTGVGTDTVEFSAALFASVFALTLLGLGVLYVRGGKDIHRITGAESPPDEVETELTARLRRLAELAEAPTPDIAYIDSHTPNAYTTGTTPENATVVVTRGLVETLGDDELDAVLAHELAHIKNRDAAVMSIVSVVPAFTYAVFIRVYQFMRRFAVGGANLVVSAFSGKSGPNHRIGVTGRRTQRGIPGFSNTDSGQYEDTKGKNTGQLTRDNVHIVFIVLLLLAVTAVVTVSVSAVFWLASIVLFLLLSRYREYAADRGAAAITGDPLALASALTTINEEMDAVPDYDLRRLDGGAHALFISPLARSDRFGTEILPETLRSHQLFLDSHPPTGRRIERLRDLAGTLES